MLADQVRWTIVDAVIGETVADGFLILASYPGRSASDSERAGSKVLSR
jgi:hypothetical protein